MSAFALQVDLLSTVLYTHVDAPNMFLQKKEAEEIRQHCETLNNIILAEFDYFSNTMVGDFENIILNLLKEQAIFHKQVSQCALTVPGAVTPYCVCLISMIYMFVHVPITAGQELGLTV